MLLTLPAVAGYGLYRFLLFRKSKQNAWEVIQEANDTDPYWHTDRLKETVRTTFHELQKHWSENDFESCGKYLHPSYEEEFHRELKQYINAGQYNRISDIRIREVHLVLARNYSDDDRDLFVAHIEGSMKDWIEDQEGNIVKKQGDEEDSSKRNIDEYWYFQRQGDQWLVKDITEEATPLHKVSLDKENWPKSKKELDKLDHTFAEHLEAVRFNKKLYIMISALAGILVGACGYAFYAWLGYVLITSII